MAQKQKGHSQFAGKYLKRETSRAEDKYSSREKNIAMTTVNSGKGYQHVVASMDDISSEVIGSQLAGYILSAGDAVKLAQEQVHKAQEQLREAQDVEKAMLELAQLQEVRRAHQDLYGPDKNGLTAAQQFLAFKQRLREQQPE